MPEVTRRRLVTGAAWAVPVVLVGQPAAAAACSPGDEEVYYPALSISSTTQTKTVNGHTIGTFSYQVCNVPEPGALLQALPAGTQFQVIFAATKAPGTAKKDIVLTPRSDPGLTLDDAGARHLNPDGPPKGEATVAVVITLASPLQPGDCRTQVWDIDSSTGVGATELSMTVTLLAYGTGGCGRTGAGGEASETGVWGAGG
jgi:hypothetical protein